MKIRRLFVIVLIISLAILTGCADKKYPENVVAIVNGITITEEEIVKEITERKMFIAIGEKVKSLQPNSLTPEEFLTQALNINDGELTLEQIRYLESTERSTTKLININEAFNILLREEVLYQEAKKQGHDVSKEKAKQVFQESNQATEETLKDDKEAWEKWNKLMEYANKIYKEHGFESEEDYLNQRIVKSAQAMPISRMKSQFNKVMADKLPETNSFQINVAISNAWDDYGEFLLDRAKVKILNAEYSVELYGNPWSYGILDLKL